MKINEVIVTELKLLDTTEYGGWITPNKKVHYVSPYKHESFAMEYLQNELTDEQKKFLISKFRLKNIDWMDPRAAAFALGMVRFQIDNTGQNSYVFSIDGSLDALRKTYNIWGPTALRANDVYLEDKMFEFPKDKAKFIKLFANG